MTDIVDEIKTTAPWNERHLLGLENLSAQQITTILDLADKFGALTDRGSTKLNLLNGTVVANLFFENSTRTKTSFNIAARRLGADTVDFSASSSSLSKGETFIDTALTIEAMGVDLVVCRHARLVRRICWLAIWPQEFSMRAMELTNTQPRVCLIF